MSTIKSLFLTGDAERCREGINWFRNAEYFVKDVRDRAIASANKMAFDGNNEAQSFRIK